MCVHTAHLSRSYHPPTFVMLLRMKAAKLPVSKYAFARTLSERVLARNGEKYDPKTFLEEADNERQILAEDMAKDDTDMHAMLEE